MDTQQSTLQAARSILARRALTSGELHERLLGKGHDPSTTAAVVEDLLAQGMIDELDAALQTCRQVLRGGAASAELLHVRLSARGLCESIIEQAIQQTLQDTDPTSDALAWARTKLRPTDQHGPAERQAAARRIGSALTRRGFDQETIMSVLDTLDLVG